MSAVRVDVAGFLTTVQDLGRPGFARLGVCASGAADPIALRVGNRLVGNPPGAAALEMTLAGGRYTFEADALVALAGADPRASAGGRELAPWTAHRVRAGTTIVCGPLSGGARAYLCVRGGLEVPAVLGSRSTHLAARLGGVDGRSLQAGDRIAVGRSEAAEPARSAVDPRAIPGYAPGAPLRVTEGPQRSWFAAASLATLFSALWEVAEASDRMGLRLDGPAILDGPLAELTTEGVVPGAVQVPGSGRPIVLLVEHPTTGGYPKIASVATADLARLGQLRPRDRLRFAPVTLDEAARALEAQEEALRAVLA